MAEAKPMEVIDAVDIVDVVVMVDKPEELELAIRLSAPVAKLTAIIQIDAESGNTLRKEKTAEESMGINAASEGFQPIPESTVSPTNIQNSGR